MSKEKALPSGMFVQDLFQVGLYKRNQGRITRQVTCAALWVVFILGAWRMHGFLESIKKDVDWAATATLMAPLAFLAIGMWVSFRAVNYPKFADFLIAVEAEMNKVSWPSKAELKRASFVVIFVIFLLMALLFCFDFSWRWFFELINVIHTKQAG